jgi:hypothetical protein
MTQNELELPVTIQDPSVQHVRDRSARVERKFDDRTGSTASHAIIACRQSRMDENRRRTPVQFCKDRFELAVTQIDPRSGREVNGAGLIVP